MKLCVAAFASVVAILTGGCIAPRIDPRSWDKDLGDPWRCTYCGHLTRSREDLSDAICPRCFLRRFVRITEVEMARYLNEFR